jgi:hypothetical protein
MSEWLQRTPAMPNEDDAKDPTWNRLLSCLVEQTTLSTVLPPPRCCRIRTSKGGPHSATRIRAVDADTFSCAPKLVAADCGWFSGTLRRQTQVNENGQVTCDNGVEV